VVPSELREFWLTTNGASFFGDPIRGTYDAVVWPAQGSVKIVFLENMYEPNVYLVIHVSTTEPRTTRLVTEEDIGEQVTRRSWDSLWECLRTILEDKTRQI
jgi:hypothetical protein